MPGDAELLAAAKRGDPDALGGLYVRHKDFVFRCACRRLGRAGLSGGEVCWDVVHDVFVHLAGRIAVGGVTLDDREGSTLRGYLYRVTMSIVATRQRRDGPGGVRDRVLRLVGWSERAKVSGRSGAAADAGGVGGIAGGSGAWAGGGVGEIDDEQSRVLCAALDRLSPAHRTVIELRLIEELSLEEIATATGVPLGTVKSRLHHALGQLRGDGALRAWWERGAE